MSFLKSPVLKDSGVRRYLFATFTSSVCWMMLATALGKHVYDVTGRELDLGLIGLAEFLPSFILVLVTGSVADRFDRRKVMAIALLAEVFTAIGLAIYAASDPTALWPFMLLAAAFGTARAFVAPASRSMPGSIVDEHELPQLIALSSLSWQAATIFGPVLGGFLYLISPVVPYTTAAVLMFISAMLALTLTVRRQPERTDRPTLSTALEGLHFVRRTPILLGGIALDLFAVLFGGAVALLPAITTDRLGLNSGGLGLLRAAGGAGAVLTGVVLAARPLRNTIGRILLISVAVFGVATIGLGLTKSWLVAAICLFILQGADMVSVFIRGTLVPLATPENMRGRVTAVEQVFIGASNELGAFESGVAANSLGLVPAVVLGGVATVAIVGIWWVAFPALRDVDTFDELLPATASG